nr:PREDICTED: uncharacterized protein LOC105662967 [Megachile rotundata]
MSERYVKDILEKLEEIEKLHSKLRTLVPRVRNQETQNNVSTSANLTECKNEIIDEKNSKPEAFRNLRKPSKANVRKLFTFGRDGNSTKNPKDNKWRRVKSNSVDFARKHWHDKKDKIKNLLSTIIERDIILVNRAAQTSGNEFVTNPHINEEKTEFASKSDQPKKRKRSVQDQLERLLEHFNYSRDADVANENRVSTHRHSLGKDDPRRAEKLLSFPDEESETLRIVSSAERVSISNNKKIS